MKFEQIEPLTDKELLILKHFSAGMLRDEVAAELKVTPKTLRVYLAHIYAKLCITKLHQAVIWYLVYRIPCP